MTSRPVVGRPSQQTQHLRFHGPAETSTASESSSLHLIPPDLFWLHGIHGPLHLRRSVRRWQRARVTDINGYRKDVFQAFKDLKVSVVRYPGGSGASVEILWCWPEGIAPAQAQAGVIDGREQPVWDRCADVAGILQQMNAADYSKQAYQWAKALLLLDPTIQLVSCGGANWINFVRIFLTPTQKKGFADWDRVTLKTLAPVVDFHSIHSMTVQRSVYGERRNHDVNVIGPAAADIDLGKIEGNLTDRCPSAGA
ncbi:hypothetical protein C8R44DRAFT_851560 [Mycena epipterygia]|nr:hypothetical protein C8R44DRAFT_851560 [Mycena epipterygia]